jgi:hypothetical protein
MKQRTLVVIGGGLLAGALALGAATMAFAQTPPGTSPWGRGQGNGMMGAGGMMGMMGSHGTGGYGPGGMMGSLGGPGGPSGMMGSFWGAGTTPTPLASLADAQQAFRRYVAATGNGDLVLDETMEFQNNFYAIVKERSAGTGAFELLADKQTGAIFPEFGPNMMWNTKYGHMGQNSWMGQMMAGAGYQLPSGQPTVSPDQAKQIAQRWLDQYQPGSDTETPDAFYGYYTLHTTKDGKVSGMLSVNGYTGQVWSHTWHGAFADQVEGEG